MGRDLNQGWTAAIWALRIALPQTFIATDVVSPHCVPLINRVELEFDLRLGEGFPHGVYGVYGVCDLGGFEKKISTNQSYMMQLPSGLTLRDFNAVRAQSIWILSEKLQEAG